MSITAQWVWYTIQTLKKYPLTMTSTVPRQSSTPTKATKTESTEFPPKKMTDAKATRKKKISKLMMTQEKQFGRPLKRNEK